MLVGDSRTGVIDKVDGPYYLFNDVHLWEVSHRQRLPAIGNLASLRLSWSRLDPEFAGQVHRNPSDTEAAMYERTMELLAACGYEQYEVSNYALPGFRCRHNCAYWSHEDYLGFGPSAHSFWKSNESHCGRRWWNVADLSSYTDRLGCGLLPVASEEHVGSRELVHERILLGLRSGGLDLTRLAAELGYDLRLRQDRMMGWMIEEELAVREGQVLRLTPKGYVLCDEISARLSRDVSL